MSAASQRALAHEIMQLGLNPKHVYTAEQIRHYQHLKKLGQWPPKTVQPQPVHHEPVVVHHVEAKPEPKPALVHLEPPKQEEPKVEVKVSEPEAQKVDEVKAEVAAEVTDKPKKKGNKKDKDPAPDAAPTQES